MALVIRLPIASLMRGFAKMQGKIHMGFVYANDPSFKTSALMLRVSPVILEVTQ